MNRAVVSIIGALIVLSMDIYLYNVLISIAKKWNSSSKKRFRNIWFGLDMVILTTLISGIFLNIPFRLRVLVMVLFFLFFVVKFIMTIFAFVDEGRRLLVWIARKFMPKPATPISNSNTISRSEFIIKAGIGVASIPAFGMGWGILSGAYDYQIRRVPLRLANLPSKFHGIKLAQISDIHSGSFYQKRSVLGGVEMLLDEKPDFVFFTGDIVNELATEMRDYFDIFKKIQAPLGVYSVLGNHDYGDYYFGSTPSAARTQNLNDVIRIHKEMGWDLLMNTHRRLKIENEEIGILGIENWGAGRFSKYGRMDLAVKNTDDLPVKLLLSHDPSHWRAQVLTDYPQIDAAFAGHTHGMQLGVRLDHYQWSPAQFMYKEWAGLYREKHQQLYVNVGYGFLGFPGRVGILPEITIFELLKA